MKRIVAADETVRRLCGVQHYQPGTAYRRSAFCDCVPCEDGVLLFHTLTCELLYAESEEELSLFEEELVKDWFLVPIGFDEKKLLADLRRVADMIKPKPRGRNSFTVLTTTDCNARCFYCYEMGCERITMTRETARDAADYMARVSGGEEITISWFGGEPLYNAEAIDVICAELRRKHIRFSSKMTSNGYFLDGETARKAVRDWNLTFVQITVDGTREIYNRTKAYIDRPADAYTRVLNNIEAASDVGISVTVRLNLDRNNADDMMLLADELADRFAGRENVDAIVTPLWEFAGKIHRFRDEAETFERSHALRRKLTDLGLYRISALPSGFVGNQCLADNDACEVIMPDGRLGKCEHFGEDSIIGSIYDGCRNQDVIAAWREHEKSFAECDECPLLPRCVIVKKCAWYQNGCREHNRLLKRSELHDRMLHTYHAYKNRLKPESEAEI